MGSGDTKRARQMLRAELDKNIRNADAWFLMAYTYPSISRRVDCLRRAVYLRPDDGLARSQLEYLESLPETLEDSQRAKLLHREIARYLRYGWRVERKGDFRARLVKQKDFDKAACCLFSLLYLVKRAGDEPKSLFIEVGRNGRIETY